MTAVRWLFCRFAACLRCRIELNAAGFNHLVCVDCGRVCMTFDLPDQP